MICLHSSIRSGFVDPWTTVGRESFVWPRGNDFKTTLTLSLTLQ